MAQTTAGFDAARSPAQSPDASPDDATSRPADTQLSQAARLLAWTLVAATVAGIVFMAHARVFTAGKEQLLLQGKSRLDTYLASIEGALARHDYLPTIAALSEQVPALLRNRTDRALQAKVNAYLKGVSDSAHASAVYILDLDGVTLAASNSEDPISFVGVDLSYRPYFREAAKGKRGRFYAIGTTSGVPGYFRAIPIISEGVPIGVMALKIQLDRLEAAWRSPNEIVAIADGNGVVFLTSAPGWKYKTLSRLDPDVLEGIERSRQYEGSALAPMNISRSSNPNDRVIGVTYDDGFAPPNTRRYLDQSVPISDSNWRLLLYSDLSSTASSARDAALIAGFACGLVLLAALYQLQRLKALEAEAKGRLALRRAYDRLELEVADRTKDLRDTNQRLEGEIEQRKRTEAVLREAQGSLDQASKMAALGQMAAAISHELNQPLAALRTFSDNTKIFLERSQPDEAQKNIAVITDLIERMGGIVAQLRSFSRKAPTSLIATGVKRAMSNALIVVDGRLQDDDIALHRELPDEEIHVLCDANRLDQVFINLLTNAADAVKGRPFRQIDVSVRSERERAVIIVRDSGSGIPDELMARIFDPFVTTKDAKSGLGLGLTITQEIVRSARGGLFASNSIDGGAEFRVTLPLAPPESTDV